MNKPLFFIRSVVSYKAKNNAQDFVYKCVGDIQFQTLADASALARMERHLNEVVKKAHEFFPRSAKMEVRKYTDIKHLNKIEVVVPSDKGEVTYVLIIEIATNRGEWRGGQL